jgi:hypothetical protein
MKQILKTKGRAMSVNPKIPSNRYAESFYTAPLPTRKRCKECGLHVRGTNHNDGEDHERRASKKAKETK